MDKIRAYWQTFLSLMQTGTGLALVFFTFIHLLGVSTINFGAKWFDWYATHLDKGNLFVKIAVYFIFCLILIHGLNGLRIIFRYLFKIPMVHSYLADTKYRGSYLWYIHFVTGFIMLGVIFFHLFTKGFGNQIVTADSVKLCLRNGWYFTSMIALLVLLVFHSLYGVRIFFIKYCIWPNSRNKINRILLVIGIIAVVLGLSNLDMFIW